MRPAPRSGCHPPRTATSSTSPRSRGRPNRRPRTALVDRTVRTAPQPTTRARRPHGVGQGRAPAGITGARPPPHVHPPWRDRRRTPGRLWRSTDAAVTTPRPGGRGAWRRLFTRQADSVARALTGKRGAKLAAGSRSGEPTWPRGRPCRRVQPVVLAGRDRDDRRRPVRSGRSRRVRPHVRTRSGSPSTSTPPPSRRSSRRGRTSWPARSPTPPTPAIRDVLAEGVQTGQTIDEIADGIRHVFDIASDTRRDDRPYRGDLRVQRCLPAGRHRALAATWSPARMDRHP